MQKKPVDEGINHKKGGRKMVKKVKQMLKDQKGLTLVELLAVIVILGIIAAIAVPSIGNIIDNSKKDAHIANAEQMVSAARIAYASGEIAKTVTTITLSDLETKEYLEIVKSPGTGYNKTTSLVTFVRSSTTGNVDSYTVTLVGGGAAGTAAIFSGDPSIATRANVTLD